MSITNLFAYLAPLKAHLLANVPLAQNHVIIVADYEQIDENFNDLPVVMLVPFTEIDRTDEKTKKANAYAGCGARYASRLMVVCATSEKRDVRNGEESLETTGALAAQVITQVQLVPKIAGFGAFVRVPFTEIAHHNGVVAVPLFYETEYVI